MTDDKYPVLRHSLTVMEYHRRKLDEAMAKTVAMSDKVTARCSDPNAKAELLAQINQLVALHDAETKKTDAQIAELKRRLEE